LVTFETFKDRETVLRMAKVLKNANVIVTEDLSKRTRESRQELRKFMRQVRSFVPYSTPLYLTELLSTLQYSLVPCSTP
jgi:16S rRNA C1402 (ribose-2'-O) methylase RsmI